MRSISSTLVVTLLLGACATTGNKPPSLQISNLRQGLAHVEPRGGGEIYMEGTAFPIATNGQCVAVGEKIPCMWFAVAFDYEAASDVTDLLCTTTFDDPAHLVNPRTDYGDSLKELSRKKPLQGRKGKAFWPGYVSTEGEPERIHATSTCSLAGKEVLRYEFEFNSQ